MLVTLPSSPMHLTIIKSTQPKHCSCLSSYLQFPAAGYRWVDSDHYCRDHITWDLCMQTLQELPEVKGTANAGRPYTTCTRQVLHVFFTEIQHWGLLDVDRPAIKIPARTGLLEETPCIPRLHWKAERTSLAPDPVQCNLQVYYGLPLWSSNGAALLKGNSLNTSTSTRFSSVRSSFPTGFNFACSCRTWRSVSTAIEPCMPCQLGSRRWRRWPVGG